MGWEKEGQEGKEWKKGIETVVNPGTGDQRCADADILTPAPVRVRRIASASTTARFCQEPSADVRRRAAPHCQMSVDSRVISLHNDPLVHHPSQEGCLCLERPQICYFVSHV